MLPSCSSISMYFLKICLFNYSKNKVKPKTYRDKKSTKLSNSSSQTIPCLSEQLQLHSREPPVQSKDLTALFQTEQPLTKSLQMRISCEELTSNTHCKHLLFEKHLLHQVLHIRQLVQGFTF